MTYALANLIHCDCKKYITSVTPDGKWIDRRTFVKHLHNRDENIDNRGAYVVDEGGPQLEDETGGQPMVEGSGEATTAGGRQVEGGIVETLVQGRDIVVERGAINQS